MTLATTTATAADRLLESALEQIDSGAMLEASATLWRATSQAFEALAERRGWTIDGHRRYYDVYDRIKPELPDDELFHGFSAACTMERNSIEDYELDEFWLRDCAGRVREMIAALQGV